MSNLVPIAGLSGLFDEDNLKRPCKECGGTVFWAYRFGLCCVRCVPRDSKVYMVAGKERLERCFGFVDVADLDSGLQPFRPRKNRCLVS
jgi:hypothetical protein